MATAITMPKLGLTMTSGSVKEWKKKVGDTVKKGEILFVVATDKLTVDSESPADGVLLAITVKEGVDVPVGGTIGYLGAAGEAVPAEATGSPAAPTRWMSKYVSQGLKTIKRSNIKKDMEELKLIIQEQNIIKIVVGFPKNMNNTVGPQGEKVLLFVKKMKKELDVEIVLEDERLTTVSAEKMLISGNVRREKRKEIIDKVAAVYILQTYLDRN